MPEGVDNFSQKTFDLAVVGAGSAGFSAAITAAEAGASVALIGHGTIGGTCVNIGCVPSKTLIRAAEALHAGASSPRFAGTETTGRLTDWRQVVAEKDALVAELRRSKYQSILPDYPSVRYVEARAGISGEGISVAGVPVRASATIIATGAAPSEVGIPGLRDVSYLTSTSALELAELPGSLLIVGGGYIGVELGQMFARFGVEVTIFCRSRLLPEAEPEISAALTSYLEGEGIEVVSGIAYDAVAEDDDGTVRLEVHQSGSHDGTRESYQADRLLLTAGRRPNTDGMGLPEAGIELDRRGAVRVDDCMRTTRPGVYAAGDVTGRDEFVYMAAYGARIAAENALNGDSRRYDNSAMPAVVFTDPQVASVGLTESAAEAAGHRVKTSTLPLDAVPRALAARDTRGLIKLVADADSDRLLGGHILAPEGADSIQTVAMALKAGLTIRDLAQTIFPYLTTVEGLKLAAQTFDKDVSKLSCCAG